MSVSINYTPDTAMEWSLDAEQTLKEVPFFIRPVVRKSIEKMAASDGKTMVDSELYARAKAARGR
ncbi:PCP reductase family protein [Synechococcus sp. A10-1-5-9]|uniref:PCP reductase family protein n=1 Tax=Synechococcus sp. A10-1-5-9 TaxID=3392295 RepID=UPI0039E765A1